MRLVTNTNFGKGLELQIRNSIKPITDAAVGALDDAAKEAVKKGRANIRSAGRFSGPWVQGLRSRTYKNNGLDAAALIYHRFGIAGIFEEGGTIRGKPLMWLPIGGRKLLARSGKNLASVNVPGRRPILVGDVQGKRIPLFVGIDVVRIRKRFNIAGIVRAAASRIGEFYLRRIRARGNG